MIICNKVKDLLYSLEQGLLEPPPPPNRPHEYPPEYPHHTYNQNLKALIQTLHHNCTRSAPLPEYPQATYQNNVTPYPLDADGFAQAFDVVEDEATFTQAFANYGVVVGKQVLPPALCQKAVGRLNEVLAQLSGGACALDKPDTWHHMPYDDNGTKLLSRGFFELYHDALWADIRQSLRLYLHHVVLWRRADLWTSFDRFGIKLPQHEDGKALNLHVDQNPTVHPSFKTLQGILALADNPADQGTFRGVPGSRAMFSNYSAFVKQGYVGEFVELQQNSALEAQLLPQVQAFPLRAGDIVTWDSRTTHANTSNVSNTPRYVAMVAAGPAPAASFAQHQATRLQAFESGLGSNARDALMHASMKPRYTNQALINQHRQPENLNLLGEYLYGLRPYAL